MTTLFSKLIKCLSTLQHANQHYSAHQSIADHGFSDSLYIIPAVQRPLPALAQNERAYDPTYSEPLTSGTHNESGV
ncbi:hypothetical protein [uncultured Vibrio sp.]|uniref:hypothetical protein n=1 Tax=uncultured Vibrio sp. TaxID=114054 RepID=UPI0025FDD505|nr:hypothetical protein [uncultured Vibrio sp.]